MLKHKLLILLVLLGTLVSCKFNPNYQGTGSPDVQGIWSEEPVSYRDSMFHYTRHDFRFTCDSFYVTFRTQAKSNLYPDSCFKNGTWTEYAKGTYVQSRDTIYLSGTFTKANWKQKISGCYRVGQYIEALVLENKKNDTLLFSSSNQHVPIKLVLKKRVLCQPKPLN